MHFYGKKSKKCYIFLDISNNFANFASFFAALAELVDAPDLGSGSLRVKVRVLYAALSKIYVDEKEFAATPYYYNRDVFL